MSTSYLVVGDVIADLTHYGHCRRLAPEDSTVPVFETVETRVTAGGAGRVYRQLRELASTHTYLAAYLGNDDNVVALRKALDASAAPSSMLLTRDKRSTPTKVRFVTESGLAFRHDLRYEFSLYGEPHPLFTDPDGPDVYSRATVWLTALPYTETVVVAVADYTKGALSSYLWQPVFEELRRRRGLVVYDMPAGLIQQGVLLPVERNRLVVKMNLEAARQLLVSRGAAAASYVNSVVRNNPASKSVFALSAYPPSAESVMRELRQHVKDLFRASDLEAVIVTLGAAGAMAILGCQSEYVVIADDPYDDRPSLVYPCGCGDIFTAVLAYVFGQDSSDLKLDRDNLVVATRCAVNAATVFATDLQDTVVPFETVFPNRRK